MAANNKRKATGVPRKTKEEWEIVKSDAIRIYIEENQSLKVTMAEIKKMYQFTSRYSTPQIPSENSETDISFSIRTWKTKWKEWGCSKNRPADNMKFIDFKGEKRALEGKDTIFCYGGTQVTASKIQNFKRRKIDHEKASTSIGKLWYMQRLWMISTDTGQRNSSRDHLPYTQSQ